MKTRFIKKTFAKSGIVAVFAMLAVSCSSTPNTYRVELQDKPDALRTPVQQQETINTYEKFPYIDFRGDRL